jgi:hypothetical protein
VSQDGAEVRSGRGVLDRRTVLGAGTRAAGVGALGVTSLMLPAGSAAASTVLAAVPTSSLVVHLDASQPGGSPGTAWQDLSGNANNATPGTGVTFEAAAGGAPAHYSFPGTSDAQRTDVGNGAIVGTVASPPTAYTKMVWFRRDTLNQPANLASSDLRGTFTEHFMYFSGQSADPLRRLTVGHNTAYVRFSSVRSVSANVWTFGAVTFSTALGFRLFLNTTDRDWNGAAEVSTSAYNAAQDALGGPMALHIGTFDVANRLDGDVATLVVHARELTEAEVKAYYASTVDRFHPS